MLRATILRGAKNKTALDSAKRGLAESRAFHHRPPLQQGLGWASRIPLEMWGLICLKAQPDTQMRLFIFLFLILLKNSAIDMPPIQALPQGRYVEKGR